MRVRGPFFAAAHVRMCVCARQKHLRIRSVRECQRLFCAPCVAISTTTHVCRGYKEGLKGERRRTSKQRRRTRWRNARSKDCSESGSDGAKLVTHDSQRCSLCQMKRKGVLLQRERRERGNGVYKHIARIPLHARQRRNSLGGCSQTRAIIATLDASADFQGLAPRGTSEENEEKKVGIIVRRGMRFMRTR